MKYSSFMLLSTMAVIACSDDAHQATAPVGRTVISARENIVPPGYVATPVGLLHSSCVHALAATDRLDRTGNVVHRDGSVTPTPPCLYQPISSIVSGPDGIVSPRQITGQGVSPQLDGWLEFSVALANTGRTFHSLAAAWTVPQYPVQGYDNPNKVYFTFPGLANGYYIIQPVLFYGNTGEMGGAFWSIASWMCHTAADHCWHSPPFAVNVGDQIQGSVAGDCAGGYCSWTITTHDETRQRTTTFYGWDSDDYTWSTSGAVEVYALTTCGNFPANGVFYTDVDIADDLGQGVLSWGRQLPTNPDPSCAFNVTTTGSTANLYHNPNPPPPPLQVSIVGPSEVPADEGGTWSAYFSITGTPPYTYEWSGILSGTEPSITGTPTTSDDLILTVHDAAGNVATAWQYVTVCPSGQRGC